MRSLQEGAIVLPALNEADTIGGIITKCRKVLPGMEILVVDGHSTDNTPGIATAMGTRVLHENMGKGHALRLAFDQTDYSYYFCIDADGSMKPEELADLKRELENGHDLVKGSRNLPGAHSEDLTPVRKIGNAAFVKMVNILFGSNYTDLCYGLFGITRHALEKISLRADGFDFETELCILAQKHGLSVSEIASFELSRTNGRGKLRTFSDGMAILKTIVSGLRDRP